MITVSLPTSTQYYNIHTLTGYPTGTVVLITNMTTDAMFIAQSATQPVNDSNSFYLLDSKSVVINTGDNPIWVKGTSGPVIVQDFSSVILPSEAINPRIMVGMEAFTVQSFVEANCKNGTQFEVTTYDAAFAAGANRDFVVVTGNLPVLIKNRFFQFTGAQIVTNIYRSPTYTGGTPITYYNLSDINPQVGLSQIIGAPTVTNVGTQIAPTSNLLGNIPQTGQAIVASNVENSIAGLERVLRPNTTYLFRTTNPTAASMFISTKSTWYEGHLSSTAF